jgi:hypothetical protein
VINAADRSAPDSSGDQVPVLSKTRRKTEMHDLQSLARRWMAFARLSSSAPERLADTVGQARGIRKHEARRRQMQYIGRLMRDVDETDPGSAAQWGAAPAAKSSSGGSRALAQAPARGLDALVNCAPPPSAADRAFRRWWRACRASERVPRRRMHIASSFAF